MSVKIAIAQIQLQEGQTIVLAHISWSEFESILEDLGERRRSRIAYYQGVLEIHMPLPEHERYKVLISNLLVILLDELGMEWESLGSTTFKRQRMRAGIELDDCFYIENYRAMIGKKRLDLEVDPVPDLAIEIDVTSQTKVSAYEALGVAEIWRWKDHKLEINLLRDGKYISSDTSQIFPLFPVVEGFTLFIDRSTELPISALRREFRQWVQTKI